MKFSFVEFQEMESHNCFQCLFYPKQNLHDNKANVKRRLYVYIYSFKSQFMIVRIRQRVNGERRVC